VRGNGTDGGAHEGSKKRNPHKPLKGPGRGQNRGPQIQGQRSLKAFSVEEAKKREKKKKGPERVGEG